jgi:RNA polymerase sigma-70 factor (ECF subfamily)
VLAAGAEKSPAASEALARLCQTYWLPIYAFIRKRGHGPHQAEDLTQEFFTGFLEKRCVALAVRERGRFRSFLMTSVENFLRNAMTSQPEARRRKIVGPLDDQDTEALYLARAPDEANPAAAFEQTPFLEASANRPWGSFGMSSHGRSRRSSTLQAHLWGETTDPYPLPG